MVSSGDLVGLRGAAREDLSILGGEARQQATGETWLNPAKLVESMRAKGYEGEPIQIMIRHNGEPVIWEGNRRAAAANIVGLEEVPVQITYTSGSAFLPDLGVWAPSYRRTAAPAPVAAAAEGISITRTDAGYVVKGHHGTRESGLPTQYGFGGLHIGTRKAALDRLEQTPSLRPEGRPGAEEVLPVEITLRKPYGTPEQPITETELFTILGLPDNARVGMKRLTDEGYDGIIYRNAVEDPGSISALAFDPTPAPVVAAVPDAFPGPGDPGFDPDAYAEAGAHPFTKLAAMQRGRAEELATKREVFPDIIDGNMRFTAEAAGDIINRISNGADHPERRSWHLNAAGEKVDRVLGSLTAQYGFTRSVNEQMRRNIEYHNDPRSVFGEPRTTKEALQEYQRWRQEYADAYRKLPTYNQAHRDAQEVAIAFGEERYDDAIAVLRRMKAKLDGPEEDAFRYMYEGADEAVAAPGFEGAVIGGRIDPTRPSPAPVAAPVAGILPDVMTVDYGESLTKAEFSSDKYPMRTDDYGTGLSSATNEQQIADILASGKESITVWHGTTRGGAEEILRTGEIRGYQWFGPGVTLHPSRAVTFAGGAKSGIKLPDSEKVILEFELPREQFRYFTPEAGGFGADELLLDIPTMKAEGLPTSIPIDRSAVRFVTDEAGEYLREGLLSIPTTAAPTPSTAPVAAPQPQRTLPSDLKGAKPRYNMGQRSYAPQFESDADKALFIISQSKRSRRDDDYLAWLKDIFPGANTTQLRAAGKRTRQHIKDTVTGQPEGDIRIPMSQAARDLIDQFPTRAPTPAPTPARAPVAGVVPEEAVALEDIAFPEDLEGMSEEAWEQIIATGPPQPPRRRPPPLLEPLPEDANVIRRSFRAVEQTAVRLAEILWDRNALARRLQPNYERITGQMIEGGTKLDINTHITTARGAVTAGQRRYQSVIDAFSDLSPNADLDDVDDYVLIRRVRDLIQAPGGRKVFNLGGRIGRISSVTQADRAMDALRARLGRKGVDPEVEFREIERAAEVLFNTYRAERIRLYEAGFINAEELQVLETHLTYNPMHYVDTRPASPKKGRTGAEVRTRGIDEIKKYPNERELESPTRTALATQLIKNEVRIENNKIVDAALTLAEAVDDKGIVKKASPADISAGRAGENFVTVWRDGEKQIWRVPGWLKHEMVLLNVAAPTGKGWRVLAGANNISRLALTSFSMKFMPVALILDMFTSWVGQGVHPGQIIAAPIFRALKSSLGMETSQELLDQAMEYSGGRQTRYTGRGGTGDIGERLARLEGPMDERTAKDLRKLARQNGGTVVTTPRQAWNLVKKAVDALPSLAEAIEQAPRKAVFRKSLNRNLPGWQKMTAEEIAATPQARQAAADAINVTINFDRGGHLIKVINPYTLFLNAGLEGFKIPLRQLITNPTQKRASAARLAALALPAMGISFYNMSYPEYFDIRSELRWGGALFMLPSVEIDERTGRPKPKFVLYTPKLREYIPFFGLPTMVMEQLFHDYPSEFSDFARLWLKESIPFYDQGVPGPEVGIEIMEQWRNRDTYFNEAIVREKLQGKELAEQVTPHTSRTAQILAGGIRALPVPTGEAGSPVRLEHALRGTLGGAYQTAAKFVDWVADAASPIDTPAINQHIAKMAKMDNTQKRDYLTKVASGKGQTINGKMLSGSDVREAILFQLAKPELAIQSDDWLLGPVTAALDPVIGRFMPEGGGGISERGQIEAEREAAGEITIADTRGAGRGIAILQKEHLDEQGKLDDRLERPIEAGGTTETIWISNRRDLNQKLNDAKENLRGKFPRAAQFAEHDARQRWYETVNTAGGFAPDVETRTEELLSGFFAIELETEVPVPGGQENPAFLKFFDDQEEYRNRLSAEDRALLDAGLASYRTAKEEEFYADLRVMRPYWDAGMDDFLGEVMRRNPGKESKVVEYFASTSTTQTEMRAARDPVLNDLFNDLEDRYRASRSRGVVKFARDRVLRENPHIESALIKWEYRDEKIPPEVMNIGMVHAQRGAF